MIIRKLETKDLSAVEGIFDKYWSDSFRTNLSEKLAGFVAGGAELVEQNFKMFVLEEDGEVVAVSAMRDAPAHMAQYASTAHPAEFYVLAVKEKNKGYGTKLSQERMQIARDEGYTEVVFFSGDTHQDSWEFHDSYAQRVSEMTAPNGERGYIWSVVLD